MRSIQVGLPQAIVQVADLRVLDGEHFAISLKDANDKWSTVLVEWHGGEQMLLLSLQPIGERIKVRLENFPKGSVETDQDGAK